MGIFMGHIGAAPGRVASTLRPQSGYSEPEKIDPFFKSTEDLQKSFKKSTKKTEERISEDRSMFLDQLGTNEDDERMSERDLALAGGDIRRHADAAANESIASTSRRLGGDTNSALFQIASTGAKGGAAAATGSARARMRLDESQSLRQARADRARAMLGLFQTEQGARGQNLQEQAFLHGIFQTDRQFQNTLDQQETQKQMFATEQASQWNSTLMGSWSPRSTNSFYPG